MELLNLIFEIRFKKNSFNVLLDERKSDIFELVTGEKPKNFPKEGFRIDHSNSKTVVVIEEDRVAISVEQDDIETAKERLTALLLNIYGQFNFASKEIIRLGARVQFMEPWQSSFTNLVSKYKSAFYSNNSLVEKSSDVALPLTFIDNNCRVNFISGPMKPDQGKGFLVFKERSLPHAFIYVDIDRVLTEGVSKKDISEISQYISDSINYSQEKAQETINLLNRTNG